MSCLDLGGLLDPLCLVVAIKSHTDYLSRQQNGIELAQSIVDGVEEKVRQHPLISRILGVRVDPKYLAALDYLENAKEETK